MSITEADLEAIEKAIANTAQSLSHGDKSVTFADLESLKKRRAFIKRELGIGKPPITIGRAGFRRDRGY